MSRLGRRNLVSSAFEATDWIFDFVATGEDYCGFERRKGRAPTDCFAHKVGKSVHYSARLEENTFSNTGLGNAVFFFLDYYYY